jgi:hypothetical protein
MAAPAKPFAGTRFGHFGVENRVLQKFGPVKGQFNRPIARTQEFGPLCNLQLGRLTAMLFS